METRPRTPGTPDSERQDVNPEKLVIYVYGLPPGWDRILTTIFDSAPDVRLRPPTPDPMAPAPPDPDPDADIPDGGAAAWLQVFASWIILLQTWGLVNTFGVFQAYYEQHLPGATASSISWIGSLQGALMMLVGVVAGPLYDAGYFRHMLISGILLMNVGMFMTSLCTTYWQAVLAQGFTIGIGMGLTFLPSTAILAQYFKRHRALAIGLASTGSPIAGMTFPILFSALTPRIGFGWAVRVMAFIILALSAVPVALMRERTRSATRKIRSVFDKTALTDIPYLFAALAFAFSFLTLYVAFFYIQLAAQEHGIADRSFSPYLVTLLSAGSIPGRVLPGAIADRFGSLNAMIGCIAMSAVLMLACFGIRNLAGAVVFAVLYGMSSGGLVSLTPSVIMGLCPEKSRIGARLGMNFLLTGAMLLIGTPIAGLVLGTGEDKRWAATIGYAAGGLCLATLCVVVARVVHWMTKGGARI